MRLVTFETFDQINKKTWPEQKKKTMTKTNTMTKTMTMTKTNTFETFDQSDEET